jgi:acetaldehyde dehydrogenase (acetylating)
MTTETVKSDTWPIIRAQDRLGRAKNTAAAIALIAESISGPYERGAISELAETVLRHIEKADRRLGAYRARVKGDAA